MLNQGFLKVERYHNLCQKQVKAQLPRYVMVSSGSNSTTGDFICFLIIIIIIFNQNKGLYVRSFPSFL